MSSLLITFSSIYVFQFQFIDVKVTLEEVVEAYKSVRAKTPKTSSAEDLQILINRCIRRKSPTDVLKNKEKDSDDDDESDTDIESRKDEMSETETDTEPECEGKRKLHKKNMPTNDCKKLKR